MEPFITTYNQWEHLQMQQNATVHLRQSPWNFIILSDVLQTQENVWEISKTLHNTNNSRQHLKMPQHPRKPGNDSEPLETFHNRSEQREHLTTSQTIPGY